MEEQQDLRIADVVAEQRARLRNFIRKRVPEAADAEDILQDVFYELVNASRLLTPIDHISGWLYRVARNRITDLLRKRRPEEELDDLLPSHDAGPEEEYLRAALVDELAAALDELPPEQRAVFVAHEIEGRSFQELAAETGVNVNTLLSRKRYAVLHLRKRLQRIHEEFIDE
jgi:RNA polymerase sigma factor (sigma-70 family)